GVAKSRFAPGVAHRVGPARGAGPHNRASARPRQARASAANLRHLVLPARGAARVGAVGGRGRAHRGAAAGRDRAAAARGAAVSGSETARSAVRDREPLRTWTRRPIRIDKDELDAVAGVRFSWGDIAYFVGVCTDYRERWRGPVSDSVVEGLSG